MEYRDYQIIQDQNTGTWIIFQDIPGHGRQVVQLAENETEAKQKVDQLISNEIAPLFYLSEQE